MRAMQRRDESYHQYLIRISQDSEVRGICLERAYSMTLEQAEQARVQEAVREARRRGW